MSDTNTMDKTYYYYKYVFGQLKALCPWSAVVFAAFTILKHGGKVKELGVVHT